MRLKYIYSVISVNVDSLPGNNKNWESTRSWLIGMRFVHPWAVFPRKNRIQSGDANWTFLQRERNAKRSPQDLVWQFWGDCPAGTKFVLNWLNPNFREKKIEPSQHTLHWLNSILGPKILFGGKIVLTLAQGKWRAAAPGLKPLRLPRARIAK